MLQEPLKCVYVQWGTGSLSEGEGFSSVARLSGGTFFNCMLISLCAFS